MINFLYDYCIHLQRGMIHLLLKKLLTRRKLCMTIIFSPDCFYMLTYYDKNKGKVRERGSGEQSGLEDRQTTRRRKTKSGKSFRLARPRALLQGCSGSNINDWAESKRQFKLKQPDYRGSCRETESIPSRTSSASPPAFYC